MVEYRKKLHSIYPILTYLFNERFYIKILSEKKTLEWRNTPVFLFVRDPLYLQQHHQPFDNSAASVREPIITCHNSHTMKMMRLTRIMEMMVTMMAIMPRTRVTIMVMELLE